MKKILFIFLFSIFGFILVSCNTIKEYTGKEIVKLTFKDIDYNGGYTINRVLDFVNNRYLANGFLPGDEDEQDLELKRMFTDEEEKEFIDGCYSNGLFNLRKNYKGFGIVDGGGWYLIIEYADGSTKKSAGVNSSPTRIFNKCSIYFYDLCGEEVIGMLPDYYYSPPGVSISFSYEYGVYGKGSDNSLARVSMANYKWNKFASTNNNIYLLNKDTSSKSEFLANNDYKLVLYTANYDCKEKFTNVIVKNYDYNENLTNEKEVYKGKWFKQIEIDLELDKIYKYTLEFKDGDFVEYTFSTKSLDSKILYGEYHYNIYQEGKSILKISDDGTYELFKFEYFDRSKNVEGSLKGEYEFNVINGKEYLSLYTNDNKRIVFEYYSRHLFINFELTTFELASYNLEGNKEFNGLVDFSFWN